MLKIFNKPKNMRQIFITITTICLGMIQFSQAQILEEKGLSKQEGLTTSSPNLAQAKTFQQQLTVAFE